MILRRMTFANEQRGNSLWQSKEYIERLKEAKKILKMFISLTHLALLLLHLPIALLPCSQRDGNLNYCFGGWLVQQPESKGHLGYEEKI